MEASTTEAPLRDSLRQDPTHAVGRPVVPETLVRPFYSDQPTLICLMGLPGSGKTCLARRLPYALVSSDDFRNQMFPEPRHTRDEHREVFKCVHNEICYYLKQQRRNNVILDATNLSEEHRIYVQCLANQAGANTLWFWLQVPREVAEERIREREGERAGELLRAMRRMDETADWPTSGFIALNGEDDVDKLEEAVIAIVRDYELAGKDK